jgi:hypothetical protein
LKAERSSIVVLLEEREAMGWLECSDRGVEHEGWVLGFVQRNGRWHELKNIDGKGDAPQIVGTIQVVCECGWRSPRLLAPLGTRFFPSCVDLPEESDEDLARLLWKKHLDEWADVSRFGEYRTLRLRALAKEGREHVEARQARAEPRTRAPTNMATDQILPMPEIARKLEALYDARATRALEGWVIRRFLVPDGVAAEDVSEDGEGGYWLFSLGKDACGDPEPVGKVERVFGEFGPRPLAELLAELERIA